MKFFLTMLMVLAFTLPVMAGGTFTVTEAQYIVVSGNTSDTLGREMITADSIRIVVSDSAGTELFDAWFEDADDQCVLNGDVITFFDQWEDINGAASTGIFSLMATIAGTDNSIELFSNQSYVVIGVDSAIQNVFNSAASTLKKSDSTEYMNIKSVVGGSTAGTNLGEAFDGDATPGGYIENIQQVGSVGWSPLIDNDSLIGDYSTLSAAAVDVNVASADADAFDGEDFATTYWDSIATRSDSGATGSSPWSAAQRDSLLRNAEDRALSPVKFDIPAVAAYYGFAIWVDDGAANTNTTVGIDGLLANPVSTLAAARVLADSMDIHRYNILNASSFTLATTYENWVFTDVGSGATIDIGSQDVDGSSFFGLMITGTQGGNGTIGLVNCQISDLHDFDGRAEFCWLVDSLVMDNNSEAFFGNCYSAVAGNGTPTLDFHVAANSVAFRNYSGGINIVGMSSNDKISIEGNGQIIVDATCSNAPITARGNFTITDNGSGTVWTRDAVFTRQEAASWVWTYDMGIWIDDNSGNTDTDVGIDGVRGNPVSTLTAARTLADALGYQKYYLTNNTSLTLAATHEDWDFIGVGESNEINFGGQDIDNSHFEHLMVAGTQGGTGLIWLDECYMDAADSLECVARNSWFSDTVSVRVATNIIFDNCFSNIPGNTTPAIDFNSAAGVISISVRHYSGGMGLLNMTSNHTISYESDGQLVIDASCTSANVTARGNMTITDNGTTTNLTDDAVFNITQNVGINWADIINPASSQPTINVQLWKGVTPADLESDFTVQAHVTDMSDNVIGSGELQDDITIPKMTFGGLFLDSMRIVNDNGTAVLIQTTTGNDHAMTIIGVGRGIDVASAGTGINVTSSGGSGVSFQSGNVGGTGFLVAATNTNGIGFKVAGVARDYEGTFDSTNFETGAGAIDSTNFTDQYWDAISNAGGSVSLPDSLLEIIAVADSILEATGYSNITSIIERLGGWGANDRGSTDSTLHVALLQLIERLGSFGTTETLSSNLTLLQWVYNIEQTVDSLLTSLGYDTPPLHEKVDNLSLSGGGSEPETLIVLDTADTTQVSGARVTVRTIDQSTVKVDGLITDVNGKLILDLDSDSFFVATVSNNYQQALDTIVVAAGGQTDTIWVTPMNPAAPTGPDMVNAYIYTWDLVGDTVVNARMEITIGKTLKPPFRDADSNLVAIPRKMVAYSDTLGLVQKSIWKSSKVTDVKGKPVTYNFKITKSNYFSALFEDRTAPDSSTWKIK